MNMSRREVLVAALCASLFSCVAVFMIFNGGLNVDEGFYGLAARAVVGGAVPYRDFGYTQTPLFLYAHGAVMRLIGFGFIEQRIASGVWALVTVAVGATWLWRRHGWMTAAGFVALVSTSLQWMYFAHLGKTHAFVGMLLMLSVVALEARPGFRFRIFWVSLLGVAAVGSRLPMGPFYLVVWVGLLARNPSGLNVAWALAWPALFSALVFVPFAVLARGNFAFWAFNFHRVPAAAKYWKLDLLSLFHFVPALSLCIVAVAAAISFGRVRLRANLDIALLGLVVTLACNLLPKGVYPEYMTPLVPSLALVFCAVAAEMPGARGWRAPALALGCLVNLTSIPILDFSAYAQTKRAASYARQFQPGDFPFVGSASIAALDAGMKVDPRMIMGSFSCTEEMPEDAVERLRMITPDGIAALMSNPQCKVFVLYDATNLNFEWSMPSYRPISKAAIDRWKGILNSDFALEYGDRDYVVFIRRSSYPQPPVPGTAR